MNYVQDNFHQPLDGPMNMELALHQAMQEKEFYLVFQPIFHLRQKKIIGMEALIRWQSRSLGSLKPQAFVAQAEKMGLMVPIDLWVIECACRQLSLWHNNGHKSLRVSVNISETLFRQEDFISVLKGILVNSKIPPMCLELEISEPILLDNIKETVSILYALKDLGLRLVIDDFGIGYSSLTYLKQFPVDTLKIDRSFVAELNSNNGDAPIARAIINFGHALNLDVLAEGIENEIQRNFMHSNGCDLAQGYYLYPPERAEIHETLLPGLTKN